MSLKRQNSKYFLNKYFGNIGYKLMWKNKSLTANIMENWIPFKNVCLNKENVFK